MVLGTPAVWLPSTALPSVSLTENSDFIVAEAKLNGTCFAVVRSAPDLKKVNKNRLVASWSVDSDSITSSRLFSSPISFLNTLGSNHLLLIHSNGMLTISGSDFSVENVIVVQASDFQGLVLSSKFIETEGENKLFLIIEKDSKIYSVVYSISLESIDLVMNEAISLDFIPMKFTIDDSLSNLCIASDKKAAIFKLLNSNRLVKSRDINLSSLSISNIAVTFVNQGYIAIMGKRAVEDQFQDKIFIIDTKYGSLQLENTISCCDSTDKSYIVTTIDTTENGTALICCVTDDTLDSDYSFKTTCSMIPYHLDEMTLLLALGKGLEISQDQCTDSVLEMCKIDKVHIFEASFLDYINSLAGESNTGKTFASCKTVSFSPQVVDQLTRKMFGDLKSFYAKNAIKYLLTTGNVSSKFGDTSIIQLLIEKKDLVILKNALTVLLDVTEKDLISCLEVATKEPSQLKRDAFISFVMKLNRNDFRFTLEMKNLDMDAVTSLIDYVFGIVGQAPSDLENWYIVDKKKALLINNVSFY